MSIYFQRDKIMILVIFIFFCLYVQYYSGDTRKDNEIIDVSLDKYFHNKLLSAEEVKSPRLDFINLALIVCGVKEDNIKKGIMPALFRLITSIFESSKGTPVNFIFITDMQSWKTVKRLMINVLDDLEYNYNKTYKMTISIRKYAQDLFYIGPFYGNCFKHLNRLLVLDIDLEVNQDLGQLYNLFNQMKREEMIGVVADNTGYYHFPMKYLLKNSSYKVNTRDEERLRGFNTGVVLYNLDRMRESKLYQSGLTPENFLTVRKEGMIPEVELSLGDQDYFTLLSWRYPQLFKILPCEWNRQISVTKENNIGCNKTAEINHLHGTMDV